MPEAWQVRQYQRQQLIEELTRKVHERADEVGGSSLYLEVVSVMTGYLQDRHKGISNPDVDEKSLAGFFFSSVLPTVNDFARTEAEGDVLVAEFLEKVLASGLSLFRAELQKQEMLTPEKIFDAHSAMAEVPIEDMAGLGD